MILVIAEKPSVGAAIGKVLGASSRKDGYLEGNNYIVSWCVGHLVGLADASSYDERFAKWRYSDLPIVHVHHVPGVLDDSRHVGGDEVAVLTVADDEGAVFPHGEELLRAVGTDNAQGVACLRHRGRTRGRADFPVGLQQSRLHKAL